MDEIKEIRRKIDTLDRKLVDLINERAKLSLAIKKLKIANNMPILDKEREDHIHKMIEEKNKGLIKKEELEKIYILLLEIMRGIDAS